MIPQIMEFCFKLVLFLLALVVQSSQKNPALQLSNSEEEEQISFVTTLCKETVDMSQQALFYVLNISPDFPIQSIVRNLHENLIGTVLITNHIWLHYSAVRQPTRNIIIFLNELDEIPSLILDSASASDETVIDRANRTSSPKLNQYCIQNDDFDLIDVNKTCDFKPHIRSSELNGDSDLTDSLSKLTRGLFANRIWNSNNYIIFMLPLVSNRGRHNIREHQLAFLFKFFWRFFKGLRTTLCIGLTCYNHDAFLNGSPGRAFQVGVLYVPRVYLYGGDTDPGFWSTLDYVTTDLKDELKCSIGLTEVANPKYIIRTFESNHIDLHEKALKLNLDMFIFEATNFPLKDVSMFDFSAAIQSCSFCFATPRSGFVPQSILPFKCFSLEVWTVILIAVLTILAAIYIFHYLQRTRFNLLYSERERLTFEHTSVILYLYSFLTIGSPSRLLLGRVVTGKILFLIVSFFVLIVVTVLQSEMTTLLSKSLRYPEIDTLEDLSSSNLFIQTQDMETSLERLQDYGFYDSLKNKLTEGHSYYAGILSRELEEGTYLNHTEFWYTIYENATLSAPVKRTVEIIRSNLQSILQSDAFEVNVFNLHQRYRANFYAVENVLPDTMGEFHLVKECVLTYPQTFIIQRNSYLSEFYMQKIISYVEAGIVDYLSKGFLPYVAAEEYLTGDEDEDPAEAFTMQHLQPAFIALGVGLTLSTIVFAVELSVDVLKGTRLSKFTRCIERFVRPSSLWA